MKNQVNETKPCEKVKDLQDFAKCKKELIL